MIKLFNKANKKNYLGLFNFLENNFDYDFYLTEYNTRIYITDIASLTKLFKNSEHIYTIEEKGDCVGVILVWKSIGGNKTRNYIKLSAINTDIAEKLLTSLLWNYKGKELFVKIRKNSNFLLIFKKKGFKFQGGRGVQLLLKRKTIIKIGEKKE